jgi:putative ABC transport system permease protein
MINHYLRLAWKVFVKYKYYTLINIFGLVSGMLSSLIIGKYIGSSLQFDSFHVNRKLIHSISQQESIESNVQQERHSTYQGVANLIAQFPEVRLTTNYMQHVEALVIGKGENGNLESFTERGIFISDSNFFNVFTFPFVHGNSKNALSRVNSVVLTQSIAQKYFRDANPIGKTLSIRTSWGEEIAYEVTGVTQNIPLLSRFRFDFLINHPTINPEELWNLPDYSIHVLLDETANASDLAQKVSVQLRSIPELQSANKNVTIALRSLTDIKLSNTEYLLVTVGIVIAVICWLNYLNQNIAQAYWRMKEVGVLTVLGASKGNLRAQFAVESSLICLTALLLVIGSYLVLENWLQSITNGHLLPLIGDPTRINTIFLLIFVIGVTLASSAPTWVLFRQNVEKILRSSFAPQIGGVAIRRIFVVVQFAISTVLMVGIFVIVGQLDYMENKDKGINLDNVFIVKAPMAKDTTWGAKTRTLQLFKQQCAELPFITEVASSTTVPSEEYRQETYLSLKGDENRILVHQNGVDDNFFSLYKVQFVAGHDFIPNAKAKNLESIILNEAAARALGFSDPNKLLNTKLIDHENPEVLYDVIGIVKNYHQTSLKYEVRPLAFRYNLSRGHCSLKFDASNLDQGTFDDMLNSLKDIWKGSYPDASFDYFFLDEKFRAQDQEDQYFASLFKAFTILSVTLSCLGLFGLSILIATKTQKEVGVRKICGASSLDILSIFMKSYLTPLAIALILGSVCAYFLMNTWLENYANRIEIRPGLMFSAVLTLMGIFILTVSYHTIKASKANPVNVLRN